MPLFWLSIAFLSGTAFGPAVPLGWQVWLSLSAASFLAVLAGNYGQHALSQRPLLGRLLHSLAEFSRPRSALGNLPVAALVAATCFGIARYQLAQPAMTPGFIAWYAASEEAEIAPAVELQGIIVKPADLRERYTALTISVENIRFQGESSFRPVEGLVLARVAPTGTWRYGDRVRITGSLEIPPEFEDFSYRNYLARKGVHAYFPWAEAELLESGNGNSFLATIYALKQRSLDLVYILYPDPEASLLAGILLGVESGISEPVQEAFKATGTSHIIAISGFNMVILAGLFANVFGRLLGKRAGAVASILGIALYTLFVGAAAAVVRAAIMSGLALFARQVGRRQDGLNALAFTAALMALFNPNVLGDVGFQLSAAATLGLVLYAAPLAEAFTRLASRCLPQATARRLAGPAGEYLLFTLAAQVTTIPIIAYHFQRISLVSLVANPLILPAQPAVMIAGGFAVILGLVWLPLGKLAGLLAWPFAAYTIRVVEAFARLPAGELRMGEVAPAVVVVFYAALFAWTLGGSLRAGLAARLKPATLLSGLALVTILTWRAALNGPDGHLHLILLDSNTTTASGTALLVQTPNGGHLLVGGGPSASRLSDALGRRLPLSPHQLDWLVVAAINEDHTAALPRVIERWPPANVLWAGPANASYSAQSLHAALIRKGIPITTAQPGQVLELGDGAHLEVLAAGERGAVLLLEQGGFRAVLPVGISREDLEALDHGRSLGPASALLLADAGYALTNPPAWLANLRPELALLSVAPGDRRGNPSSEVIEALEGVTLLRTDRHGWIHITTDGDTMWVEASH
jgi:competence protein ComEC